MNRATRNYQVGAAARLVATPQNCSFTSPLERVKLLFLNKTDFEGKIDKDRV